MATTPSTPTADRAAARSDEPDLRETIRARYAQAARAAEPCCGDGVVGEASTCGDERFGIARYGTVLDGLPSAAVATSLGCGDPTSVADLHQGEIVLDLGSGAGLDVLLSARRVGPNGHVYGVDMTEEMLELARRNAAEADADNVTFLAGTIEELPLPDGAVDVVLSNCVLNLSTDKPAVFAELARVLRPGGRVAISDVVAEDHLSPVERAERGSTTGCIAGAMSIGEYRSGLEANGFTDIEVACTHEVADSMHAAVIRAVRPAS